ncbi:MAG TPA: arabinofuranosidase catalytic domain-containing protein, partial [Actinocrinis sp.]|nr:arabinofuranosidase catalytic domain-containing protein [Actinocrinis sp.]
TQSGANVTVTNVSYNGSLGTGASTSFGFNGSWNNSANPIPASFSLNGTTCTGSVSSGTPTPTPTPTPLGTPSLSPSSTPSSSPSSSSSPPPPGRGPCDIYAAGGTPCVAAHSTIRALYGAYSGALYQVRRSSDNMTKDIGVLTAGGYANAAAQDSFCAGTSCVITIVYDQSGHGNSVAYEAAGGAGGNDSPSSATRESLTAGGHKAYSLYINPGNAYWHNGSSSGMPLGSQPQGAYMVTSGTHVNGGCCFDYGNSETDRKADGAGAMDAIYFGTSCWFGGCTGSGPWVQADLEYGLFPGGSSKWNPNQVAFPDKYVTAMLKNNGTTQMALKGGNAQSGSLTTLWNGSLPPGYNPMKQQGAIDLGSGGDCCATNTNLSAGTFYEGAIVAGYPSDATDAAVQANITAAGYQ